MGTDGTMQGKTQPELPRTRESSCNSSSDGVVGIDKSGGKESKVPSL